MTKTKIHQCPEHKIDLVPSEDVLDAYVCPMPRCRVLVSDGALLSLDMERPLVDPFGGVDDVLLLPWTYPWPKRVLCWIIWRTSIKYVTRLFGKSPYCKVVAVVDGRLIAVNQDNTVSKGE